MHESVKNSNNLKFKTSKQKYSDYNPWLSNILFFKYSMSMNVISLHIDIRLIIVILLFPDMINGVYIVKVL